MRPAKWYILYTPPNQKFISVCSCQPDDLIAAYTVEAFVTISVVWRCWLQDASTTQISSWLVTCSSWLT